MVVADCTMWGVVGLQTIVQLTMVDVLITDDGMDPGARE